MEFRNYDPEQHKEAIHRLWRGIGWLEKGDEEAVDLFIECGRALVAEVNGEAECLVASVPGTICYLNEELPLSAMTAVTTSRLVRKRGLAKRLTALTLANDAADGALVSGLGIFEQGYYDQLGFGSGGYENWVSFDPAQLKVANPTELPRRITPEDWEMVHGARLGRMRVHGSCNLLPSQVTRSGMMTAKNGFGFGYYDDSTGQLTHHFWCSTKELEFGPYQVWWTAYQNWGQFMELMGIFRSFGDQVHLVWMREPPGIQLQDLLKQPFQRRRISEKTKFETVVHATAYWQMRICDLAACLARTHLRGGPLRFNLALTDPVERYLDESAPWRGISGDYVVTLAPSSGAEMGTDETLPTLRASVGAFTRLWLGVRRATSLAVTDNLSGPSELLRELDEALSCLPDPKWDWDF
jgi:predicted acetyltransferase